MILNTAAVITALLYHDDPDLSLLRRGSDSTIHDIKRERWKAVPTSLIRIKL